MAGIGGDIDGGRELAELEMKNPSVGRLFKRLIGGINTTAKNANVSPTGEVQPPPPLAGVNVSVSSSGELMHVTLNHPGQVQRNARYFVEVHTDPAFGTPVVIHDAGASRTLPPIHLPTQNETGDNHSYYVRAYSQNPAGQPSNIVVAGGASSPTAFTMNGTSKMNFSPPQGSGTGPNSGQGGQGLGKTVQRT